MTGSLQVKNKKYYMVLNIREDGKIKQRWVSTGLPVKGNFAEAKEMLTKTLAGYAVERKIIPKPDTPKTANLVTFQGFIAHWLNLVESRVDPITYQSYRTLTLRHIVPYFEGRTTLNLTDVTRPVLQKFIDDKAAHGRLDGKGGLSPKSVKELKNILNLILAQAQREDLIGSNPCSLLILPKVRQTEAKFYTETQLNTLLETTKDEPLYPLIKMAIIYGLRRSEILGIKWDSIDFENNILTIKHTTVKVTEVVEKDTTKTKKSHRSFPLLPEIREMFLDIRMQKERNKKLFGKAYVNTDYVFCWPDGRPFSPDYVSHRFKKILKKYELEHIRFHELRHSCASFFINKGWELKDVQEWMGHSDISVTANIYGHLYLGRKKEMARQISNSFSDSV